MAYRIVKNTAQKVLLLITSTESNLVLLGNNSVSNVGLSDVTDTIVGASINQLWFSSDSGAGANGWDIDRDANTIWQTDSTGWVDFAGLGAGLSVDSTAANATFTLIGSRGTLLVEIQKEYATGHKPSDSDY